MNDGVWENLHCWYNLNYSKVQRILKFLPLQLPWITSSGLFQFKSVTEHIFRYMTGFFKKPVISLRGVSVIYIQHNTRQHTRCYMYIHALWGIRTRDRREDSGRHSSRFKNFKFGKGSLTQLISFQSTSPKISVQNIQLGQRWSAVRGMINGGLGILTNEKEHTWHWSNIHTKLEAYW
jgi:hypothetical protein